MEENGVLPKSIDELDPQFKYEVADQPGGEKIKQ